MSLSSKSSEAWKNLPSRFRDRVEPRLHSGESPLAWCELDLDANLHYTRTLLVLTDRRVLAFVGAESDPPTPFVVSPASQLSARAQGVVGSLTLSDGDEQVALWRYTKGKSGAVHRLVDRFAELQKGEVTEAAESGGPVCPSCGEALGDHYSCPICNEGTAGTPTRSLYRLLLFAKSRIWMVGLGVCLALAATAASLVPPYLTMPLLDNVLIPYQAGKKVDFGVVPWYLAGLALAALAAFGLGWAKTFVAAWISERVAADLRNQTYAHLQKLSLEFYGGQRTGDLISRVGSDTDRICFFLSVYVLDFCTDILTLVMVIALLVNIDAWLALGTLLPLPFIAWIVQRVRERLRRGFHMGSAAWAEMTSVLADTIPGIRVVKAFAQERREVERFRKANDRVLSANDRVNTVWSFFTPLVNLMTDIGLLVVWGLAVMRIYYKHLSVGALQAFLQYIARFYGRLDSMSRMMSAVQRAAASSQRIFEILDRVPSVAEPANPVKPGRLKGHIEIRDIRFQYASRQILSGINLKIREGEMVGLVGPSGAGKTTLVNLVCRFYDVTEGAILVDGMDIRSFGLEDYRKHIGIVLQEPFLFFGTIAENIAYGRPDATRDEIIAAARAARAHEFILRLPDGYDSLVGERGQSLSGGERQRISIARALLIDPRILILDEATSSVDTETEREIQLALENLIQGRTTIAIAHRLSTLRRADRLVVIERGQISEIGHHDDLLAAGGTYARLYQAQQEMAKGNLGEEAS